MIKKLTQQDKDLILDFCYKKEKENLFTIGDVSREFSDRNQYYGYFENKNLLGLLSYFGKYKSLVINGESDTIVEKLTEFAIEINLEIENTPNFEKYGKTIINTLNKHRKGPKKQHFQTVYTLKEEDFTDFSNGEEKIATEDDKMEIAILMKNEKSKEKNPKVTQEDLDKINVSREFILKIDGKIVSKANIHGISKNYFQIGGVVTDPDHRGKGYATRVVSFLCKHFFKKGIKYGLLFTGNKNFAAQTVYKKIGFKENDKYLLPEF